MLQLNMIHLDTRKILILNNLYIARDDLEKNFTTRNRLIDWLFSYD